MVLKIEEFSDIISSVNVEPIVANDDGTFTVLAATEGQKGWNMWTGEEFTYSDEFFRSSFAKFKGLFYYPGHDAKMNVSARLAKIVDSFLKDIKIGKDSSSDVIVTGFTVGKTAATISKRPNGYYLSYVGGSKIKINNEILRDSAELNEFDVIEIGNVKLQFFTKE